MGHVTDRRTYNIKHIELHVHKHVRIYQCTNFYVYQIRLVRGVAMNRVKIAMFKKAITHGNKMNRTISSTCTYEYMYLTMYPHACVSNKSCQMSSDDKLSTSKGSTFLSPKGHNCKRTQYTGTSFL